MVVHGLSCSVVCGIFLDPGWNPCLLHWQADSLALSHPGSFPNSSWRWRQSPSVRHPWWPAQAWPGEPLFLQAFRFQGGIRYLLEFQASVGSGSLGGWPASGTGWSRGCCQFRHSGQLIKGHSEQTSQQTWLRTRALRRLGWSEAMVPSLLCLATAPPHSCGFVISSQEKLLDSPPSRENRIQPLLPTPPAASSALPKLKP